jgi:phosphate acetyltransferase
MNFMPKTKTDLISVVKQKAKKLGKRIIFPESTDPRTLQAIKLIIKEQTAKPILIGKPSEIQKKANELKIEIDWWKTQFLDPQDPKILEKYSNALFELRKEKGISLDDARKLLENPNYVGVMAVELGDADGMISGAVETTGETVKPALQIIKTKEKFHKVSGIFFMVLEDRLLLFADCAINIEPNSHDLADIAIDTAETAKRFGIEPKIAMLSFATGNTARHPFVDKIREAVELAANRVPELVIEGPMQVDAALIPEVAERKWPDSKIKGTANVLIFPDLQSGNIAYKLVERLAKAKAIGPILQGLQKPVNDLSRGCSYHDIADLAAFTACEAEEIEYGFQQGNIPEIIRQHAI